ncbi:hypothetical protein VNI00_017903 [Paramarasmius palmivorus]|uniref:Uncharacterized protein n=1 Tax=Paramarasmius palmivorus TaxID=297713 RepID=A0AAW0B1L2_9AGAR
MCSLRLPTFASLLSNTESCKVLPEESRMDEDVALCHAPLVRAMPWFTGVVFSDEHRFSILPVEMHAMATGLLGEFRRCYEKPVVREIVENRTWLSPNQKTAEPLPAILFGLKMLDVCSLVGGGAGSKQSNVEVSNSIGITVPRTVFQGTTGKLRGVRSLSDRRGWPQALLSMRSMCNSTIIRATRISLSPGELEMTTSQRLALVAISILDRINEACPVSVIEKAARNLEVAALFINYMLQGNFDLPLSTETLVTELETLQMLRAWYHYGSARPAVLRRVETLLWDQLFAIARGLTIGFDALTSFLSEASPLLPLAKPESNFFHPSLGIKGSIPMGISCDQERVSKQFLQIAVASGEYGAESGGCSSGSGSSDMNVDPSCELSSLLDEELWTGGESGGNKVQGVASTMKQSNAPLSVTSMEDALQVQDGNAAGLLDSSDRQSQDLSTRDAGSICRINCGSRSAFQKLEEASLKSSVDELDALDYLIRRSNYYQLENGNEMHFLQVTSPSAHCETVAEQVSAAISGSPILHVATLTHEEYLKLDTSASLSPLFSSGIILVLGRRSASVTNGIDLRALSCVGSCSTLRKAVDVSLREDATEQSECFVFASFVDFLRQLDAGEDGKILYFPDVPDIASGKDVSVSLHTNLYSQRYSLGFAELEGTSTVERLRWHFVATANASHSMDMSPDGLDLEFIVELGSILLFLGVDAGDVVSSATPRDPRFNVGSLLYEMPDTIGMLLLEGDKIMIRAGIPYCLVTLEPAICHGAYFYSTSTLEHTLWALVRQHFRSDERAALSDENRSLLWAILLHWHDWIVHLTDHFFNANMGTSMTRLHLPDTLSFDGLAQLFSLFAVLELSDLFRMGISTDASGRDSFSRASKARSYIRDILEVVDSRIVIARNGVCTSLQVHDLWAHFYVQQCAAIALTFDERAPHTSSAESTKAFVLGVLSEDNSELYDKTQALLDGKACAFGLSKELVLYPDQCRSMKWALERHEHSLCLADR